MGRNRPDRLTWMIQLAHVVAMRSEDPYMQAGCIAVRDDWSVAGIGYNGLPPDVTMQDEWWADRDGRRPFMIHSEVNAMRYSRPGEVTRIISTHIPCANCMTVLGSYRVREVYYTSQLGEAHDLETIIQIATLNKMWLHNVPLIIEETKTDEQPANDGTMRWA